MKELTHLLHELRCIAKKAQDEGKTLRLTQPVKRGYADQWITPVEEFTDFGDEVYEVAHFGLYGRHGALPDYFTDQMIHLAEDNQAMRHFMDIFNQRYFHLLIHIWQSYHFFNEDTLRPRNEYAQRQQVILDRLSGVLAGHRQDYMHGLRWHQMYLYRQGNRTILGLQSILDSFFPDLEIELQTYVAQYRRIPEDQWSIMGKSMRIGREGNFLVGSKIKDLSGTFQINVKNLNYDSYTQLLPNGNLRRLMQQMVHNYTQGQWDCKMSLELRADEIPQWTLGERSVGRDVWVHCLPMRENALIETGGLDR